MMYLPLNLVLIIMNIAVLLLLAVVGNVLTRKFRQACKALV
jgi:hypothetical protein